MRAKTICESISFERGLNPKEVLGIGAVITLDKKYNEIMSPALKQWENFLQSLVGKKISCNMAEYDEEDVTWKKEQF